MKIIKTECMVKDLSPEQVKECQRLSFREGGLTSSWVASPANRLARVVLLHRESDGLFLGWGIALTNKRKIGIYVGPHWRRRGLGTLLVNSLGKKLICIPHDNRSAGLFLKTGLLKEDRASAFGVDIDKYKVKT